jgi:CRISPR-associated protein Csx10
MNVVRFLPYTLTLHSPAVLTDIGGDPNSSASLGYIPGSAIRGAVARRIGDPDRSSRRDDFDRLILSGAVRYLNAYPLAGRAGTPGENVRAFPAPISIRVEKDAPAAAHDLAASDCAWPEREPGRGGPNEQLKAPEYPFLTLEPSGYRGVAVPLEGTIHNQRDRERGRAWKRPDGSAAGAIFHYESVSRGERFGGVVVLEGDSTQTIDDLADDVRNWLTGRLLLGRSRRSEYGGDATIAFGQTRSRELAQDTESIAAGQRFRCVLLSRYVARDARTGQPDPRSIETEVLNALGAGVSIKQRFFSFATAGGYNNKWRLQLPQAMALEAGSMLVLESDGAIDGKTLQALEAAGFGERRTEGFGRVAFLEIKDPHPFLKPPEDEKAPSPPATEAPALVLEIEKQLVRVHLERAIDQHAADLVRDARNIPSPALLSRIRTPLRKGVAGLQQISRWLDADDENALRRRAMEPLERCRLGTDQNLAGWLRTTAANGPVLPGELTARIAQRVHVMNQESARAIQKEVGSDQTMRVRLIDATLATLIRSRKLAD